MPVSGQSWFSACVGSGIADRNALGCLQKIQGAVCQIGKDHRKELCSFVGPSRSRKIYFNYCCSQLQMGHSSVVFFFFCRTIKKFFTRAILRLCDWVGFFYLISNPAELQPNRPGEEHYSCLSRIKIKFNALTRKEQLLLLPNEIWLCCSWHLKCI